MIKFISVEYKNIMSVGNHPITIHLDKSPTTVIGGQNGSGKSTSILALTYCLYGKMISGIKLDQAINSINKKNLLVKCNFERYGESWTVVRGEKPKKFEIYRDDELLDQYANARDQQAFLEVILGMDYKLFTQMVVINKERYVPFMEMSAADRRKIIEDVLDISVFSYMNDELKERIKTTDSTHKTLLNDYRVLTTELDGKSELVKQIQESIKESSEEHDKKVNELESEEKKIKKDIEVIEVKIESLTLEGFDNVKKDLSEFNKLGIEFESEVKRLEKDKKFFTDNDNCPTCGQSIDDHKHDHIIEIDEKIEKIQSVSVEMIDAMESLLKEKSEFEKIEKTISEFNQKKRDLTTELNVVTREMRALQAKKPSTDSQSRLEDVMKEYDVIEDKIRNHFSEIEEIETEKNILDQMRDYLKDDGIKAQIVKEYNTIMNKKINEYLNAMGFYVNMTIDENFKETFHSMGRQGFTYENLSSGQKCRVSIAITLALLEIGSIKNSVSTNILYMDELLEPVDAEGVKDVMRLFREKLSHKNIYVVTQRFDEFSDQFQSQIKFKLNQGFTEIEL